MLIAAAAALFLAGRFHTHIIHFNIFIVMVAIATLAYIVVVVAGSEPGDRLTRDRIQDEERSP